MTRGLVVIAGLGAVLGLSPPVAAQPLAQQVSAVGTGTVRMSYAARAGVCGDGRNYRMSTRHSEWRSDCDPGPVRVVLEIRDRRVAEVRTYIGGRWGDPGGATDLGMVSAPAAARYLLDLAERQDGIKGDLIGAAVMADSAESTGALFRIARATDRPRAVRTSAIFWLGQEAGEMVTRGLADLAGDASQEREIRKQVVFALSQLSDGRGVPALLGVARTDRDPAIRKQAMFWLGQSDDPRALALFEEVLAPPGRRPQS